MLTYSPLWETLRERGMTRTELAKDYHVISSGTLAKLGRNSPVSTETVDKLCRFLKVPVGSVIEFVDQ